MARFPESTDTPTEAGASGIEPSLESRLDVLIILTFHARALVGTLGKLARAHTHEDILQLADAYSLRENQFYFDRDAVVFNCLLN